MQWIDESGAPRLLTQAEWWLRTDAVNTPTPATDRKLEVLDREGPFAMIEARSTICSSWHSYRPAGASSARSSSASPLLLKTHDGWKIAAVAWGDPTAT
jgi:hypothetical protein